MFCPHCGTENIDGGKFCTQCGRNIAALGPNAIERPPADKERAGDPVEDNLDEQLPTHSRFSLYPGRVLAGQYRITARIGGGGMAEVWKAQDVELGSFVAIKVPPPQLQDDDEAIAALKREALVGRQLTHRNICHVYGFHRDADLKFIVMEFVEGRTLAKVRAESVDRRMPWSLLEPIASQIADALDFAHTVSYTDTTGGKVFGVLHRDIKPSNIMLTTEGIVKVVDFGIAREIHDGMLRVSGTISKTPLYASPEQMRGEEMTPASDIYSFAAVLYECLVGRTLVTPGPGWENQIRKKKFEPVPWLPQNINDVLKSALAKDPASRPRSASDLVHQMALPPDTAQVKALKEKASEARKRDDLDAEKAALEEIHYLSPRDPDVSARLDEVKQKLADRKIGGLLRQAGTAVKVGDFAKAQRLYDELLNVAPENGDALEGLRVVRASLAQLAELHEQAKAFAGQKRHGDVLRLADQILKIKPDDIAAAALKAEAQQAASRIDRLTRAAADARAKQQFEKEAQVLGELQAISPDDDAVRARMAEIEAAIRERDTRRELDSAAAAVEQVDFDAAERFFRRALELSPGNEPAAAGLQDVLPRKARLAELLEQARQHAAARRHREAVNTAREIIKIKPDHADAAGIRDQAQDSLRRIGRLTRIAEGARGEGDLDREKQTLDELLPLAPEAESPAGRIAELDGLIRRRDAAREVGEGRKLLDAADFEGARDHFQRALEFLSNDPDAAAGARQAQEAIERIVALMDQAIDAARDTRHDRVLELTDAILAIKPDHEKAANYRGEAQRRLARLQDIKEKARACHEQGDFEQGKRLIREAQGIAPWDAELNARLAEADSEIRRRDAREARDRGMQALAAGSFLWAQEELSRAEQLVPGDTDVLQALLDVRNKLEEIRQAIYEVNSATNEAERLLADRQWREALDGARRVLAATEPFAVADSWEASGTAHEPIEEVKSLRERARQVAGNAQDEITVVDRLQAEAFGLEKRKHYDEAVLRLLELARHDADQPRVLGDIARVKRLTAAQRRRRRTVIAACASACLCVVALWIGVNVVRARVVVARLEAALDAGRYDRIDAESQKVEAICALPLVPDGPARLALAREIRQKSEVKIKFLRETMKRAQAFFDQQDFDQSLREYQTVVNEQSDFAGAADRIRQIEMLQRDITKELDSAAALVDAKKYEDARRHIQAVVQLQKKNARAAGLAATCTAELGKYETLLSEGSAALARKDLAKARGQLELAKAAYPSGTADGQLAELGKLEAGAKTRLAAAHAALAKQNYEAARDAADDVLQNFDKTNTDAAQVKADATKAIAEIVRLWGDCSDAEKQGHLDDAWDSVVKLLEIKLGHEQAIKLKQDVGERRAQRDKHLADACLAVKGVGKDDLDAYRRAREQAHAALRLDPSCAEARRIFAEANRHAPPDGFVFVEPGIGFSLGMNSEMILRFKTLFPDVDPFLYEDETKRDAPAMKPFLIGIREVANAEFCQFLNESGEAGKIEFASHPAITKKGEWTVAPGDEGRAVTDITWSQAAAYCDWYGGKLGMACSLPTEAQWEAAAGWDGGAKPVGRKRIFPWGDDPSAIKRDAAIPDKPPIAGSTPVDISPWKVLDMGGGVAEWSADPYRGGDDAQMTVKGGSWLNRSIAFWRTTARVPVHPSEKRSTVGFRIVAQIPDVPDDDVEKAE